jgi:WhiB family transcriptional regulator, redox-sensing transcriptional regulator
MTRAQMPRPHEVAAARRDPRLLRAVAARKLDVAWRTRGACQTADPETFYPPAGEQSDAAVALCRNCDVQGACLAWALEAGDCHGVWGATTPKERRAMTIAWCAVVHGMQPSEDRYLKIIPLLRRAGARPVGVGCPGTPTGRSMEYR